ncbi:hypothetical protein NEPAR04_0530 [Nematocida parisii]|nr:hypothetical protein NEPAR03_0750 [Nematocida parisii]KAI5128318.1 hypothetical protein NEPAR08_1182 [Nematocida parisii]KAI5140813.1 hypothetical protein NEPAR04_0530 [Nematocida parisii]
MNFNEERLKEEPQKRFVNNQVITSKDMKTIVNILMGIVKKEQIFPEIPESLMNMAYNILFIQLDRIINPNSVYNDNLYSNKDGMYNGDNIYNTNNDMSSEEYISSEDYVYSKEYIDNEDDIYNTNNDISSEEYISSEDYVSSSDKKSIYNEDDIISKINMSVNHVKMVINIIIEEGNRLKSMEKEAYYYNLMKSNHLIAADIYRVRHKFFCDAIDKLCNHFKIKKLDDEMSSNDALISLFELTESKESSRLQSALNLIMNHSDKLAIEDKNGLEQSNSPILEISDEDIRSLQLLRKVKCGDIIDLLDIIYESICIKNQEGTKTNSLYFGLYIPLYDMFLSEEDIKDIELYKKKNTEKIQNVLSILQNIKSMTIRDSNLWWNNLKAINKHPKFNLEKFKNNVVQKYLEAAEDKKPIVNNKPEQYDNLVGVINGSLPAKNSWNIPTFMIIIAIFSILLFIVGSITAIYLVSINMIVFSIL